MALLYCVCEYGRVLEREREQQVREIKGTKMS